MWRYVGPNKHPRCTYHFLENVLASHMYTTYVVNLCFLLCLLLCFLLCFVCWWEPTTAVPCASKGRSDAVTTCNWYQSIYDRLRDDQCTDANTDGWRRRHNIHWLRLRLPVPSPRKSRTAALGQANVDTFTSLLVRNKIRYIAASRPQRLFLTSHLS